MLKFVFLCCFLVSTVLCAETSSCQPLILNGTTVQLSTGKPTLIMFHNVSMRKIYITSPSSTFESSFIEPDKWSLLAVVQNELSLNCIESMPGHEQYIQCGTALTICQLSASSASPTETKWIAENTGQPNSST